MKYSSKTESILLIIMVIVPIITSFGFTSISIVSDYRLDLKDDNNLEIPNNSGTPYFSTYLTSNSSSISPSTSIGENDHASLNFEVIEPANYRVTISQASQYLFSNVSVYTTCNYNDTLYMIRKIGWSPYYEVWNSTDGGFNWGMMYNFTVNNLLYRSITGQIISFAIAPDHEYWYLAFINSTFSPTMTKEFSIIKSSNMGKSWSNPIIVNTTDSVSGAYSVDIAVNSTGAIYMLYTFIEEELGSNRERAVIAVSEDHGDTWEMRAYYPFWWDYFSDAMIAINPVTDVVVGMFSFDSNQLGYMISVDGGQTFSLSNLDESNGLTFYYNDESGNYNSRDLQYDLTGRLFLAYIAPISIRYAYSDNDGSSWTDGSDILVRGVKDFGPLSLCVVNTTQGYNRNQFVGNLSIVYLTNTFTSYMNDLYFKQVTPLNKWEGSLLSPDYIYAGVWQGNDFNLNILPDGKYNLIAQCWDPVFVLYFTTTSSEMIVEIDDQEPSFIVDLNLGQDVYLSPISSPGIQDSVELTFTPSEDISYELTIENSEGYQFTNDNPISANYGYEHQPDLYCSDSDILYSVYSSNLDGSFDIFFRKSNDGGISWSTTKKIVANTFDDFDPAIAIYHNMVYVVWTRIHNDLPEEKVYMDMYFIKSTDGGNTWGFETNLTSAYWQYDHQGTYYNPDIDVDSTGRIYIVVTDDYYILNDWGEVRYSVYFSTDSGENWSKTPLWDQTSDTNAAIVSTGSPNYPSINENPGQMSIAIDSEDNIHLLYDDFFAYADRSIEYVVSTDYGSSYSSPVTLWRFNPSIMGNYYNDHSIAVNKNGEILASQSILNLSMQERNYQVNLTFFNPDLHTWSHIGLFNLSHIEGAWSEFANRFGGSHVALTSNDFKTGFEFGYTYSNNSVSNYDILYLNYQKVVWERNGLAEAFVSEVVLFDGMDQSRTPLSDGEYLIKLTITDKANMKTTSEISLIIDNTLPTQDNLILPDALATPTEDNEVSLSCYDENLNEIYIMKRNNTDTVWIKIPLALVSGDDYECIINGYSTQKRVSYKIYITDLAGNTLIIDDNGENFMLYSPEITHTLVWGTGNVPTTYDPLEILIKVSYGSDIIDYIVLTESINNITRDFNMNISNIVEGGYQVIYNASLLQNYTASLIGYNITCVFLNQKNQTLASLWIAKPAFSVLVDHILFDTESTDNMRPLDGQFQVAIAKDKLNTDYIDHLLLNYSINQSPMQTVVMTENSTHYFYIFEGSQQIFYFTFEIIVVDIKDETHSLNNPLSPYFIKTQEFIPLFPEFNPSGTDAIIIGLMSGALGLIFGIGFVTVQIREKRNTRKQLLKQLESESQIRGENNRTKEIPMRTNISIAMTEAAKKDYNYVLFTIITALTAAFGLYLMESEPLFALLFFTLMLLSSTYVAIQRLVFDSKNIIHGEKVSFSRNIFFTYVHVFLILVSILLFLYAGTKVDWFAYYILEDYYTIGGFNIPKIYVSLIGVFISSVLFIAISTIGEAKKVNKNTTILKNKQANWRVLFFHKDESVEKLKSRATFKLIVFLLTLGATIITTTSLTRYMNAGLLIILPFVLMLLVVIIIQKLLSKMVRKKENDIMNVLVEPTKTCPKCNSTILFDSVFCDHCGATNSGQTHVIRDVKKCLKCETFNPKESEFCRICGSSFRVLVKEENK